jgi:predicted nucleic acid-binding protein
MTEMNKSILFAGIAVLLVVIAYLTAPVSKTPDAFFDVGEEFFPDFVDPNDALSLEVIDYDEKSGSAKPFKVEFKDGLWRIPSHYYYPADGKDRLAKTAAGVIGIKKDDFRTDNVSDHEACGVIDPLDETALTLKGRGKRVTLKGKNDKVLADFIIGQQVEEAKGYRFVRVPEQKRVYAVKMDIDLSTKFSDWIETDVLQVDKEAITKLVLHDYSIDENTKALLQRDILTLNRSDAAWTAEKMAADQEVDTARMNELLTALDELTIVDVRKKPTGLSQGLGKMAGNLTISQADGLSLQSKGYYFGSNGQLLSNEGELNCETRDGVKYILRFGEVVSDSIVDIEGSGAGEEQGTPGENRYLFITTEFDAALFPEPDKPVDLTFQDKEEGDWTEEDQENKRLFAAHAAWQQQVDSGKKISNDLNRRFADWYYVISSSSFDKLNLTRTDLVKQKGKKEEKDAAAPGA